MLGPCLLFVYTNDLVDRVALLIRLFADVTIVYRLLASATDCQGLQADLRSLEQWESEWDMDFQPDKCSVLSITRSRQSNLHQYVLHGKTFQSVTSTKYLGVTLQHDTKWDQHTNNVITKASKTLTFLRRNLKIGSTKTKELAYKVLQVCKTSSGIRQYCLGPPHKEGHLKDEMIERRAKRFVPQDYHLERRQKPP